MHTISKSNENSHLLEKASTAQKCLQCDKVIRGRIDKKFCDDWCRNNFNNALNRKRKKRRNNIKEWAAMSFVAFLFFHYIKNKIKSKF